jgi:hypothetical protein
MKHHQDASVESLSRPLIPLAPQVAMSHREDCSAEPGDFAFEAGRRIRISSLTPLTVSVGALLMGSALTLAAMLNASTRPVLAALLLLLAAAHILVGLALKTTLKFVSFDGQCYRITGLLRTEELAPRDVCLVVEARGVLWSVIRLHFNRPTRFGYGIAFVPVVSRKDFAACLRGFRNPSGSSLSSMESR